LSYTRIPRCQHTSAGAVSRHSLAPLHLRAMRFPFLIRVYSLIGGSKTPNWPRVVKFRRRASEPRALQVSLPTEHSLVMRELNGFSAIFSRARARFISSELLALLMLLVNRTRKRRLKGRV